MPGLSPADLFLDYYYGNRTACDAAWQARRVKCSYSKFYFIQSGHCRILAGGQSFDAQPGDLFLIPAGTEHSYFHEDARFVTKYWFHFQLTCGGKEFLSGLSMPFCVRPKDAGAAAERFRSILELSVQTDLAAQLRLKAEILEMTALYMELAGCRNEGIFSESTMLERLRQYIESNLSLPLTLQEQAQFAHLHPNYLIRFFKKHMGVPPMRYVMQAKLEKAVSLLENTDIPVTELADLLGFSDINQFYKRFRAYTGTSPTEFRDSFRQAKSTE